MTVAVSPSTGGAPGTDPPADPLAPVRDALLDHARRDAAAELAEARAEAAAALAEAEAVADAVVVLEDVGVALAVALAVGEAVAVPVALGDGEGEAVEIAEAVREEEERLARERMVAAHASPEKFSELDAGESRAKAAKATCGSG